MQQNHFRYFMMLVLLAGGFRSIVAQADDLEEAQESYKNGVAAFEQQKYDEALEKFKEAYNLSEKPAILYNLAVCQEKLGQNDHAVAYYELYLEELPGADDAEFVKKKVAWLTDPENNPPPPDQTTGKPDPATTAATTEPSNDADTAARPESTEDETPLQVIAPPNPDARRKKIIQGLLIGLGSLVAATGGLTAIGAYKKYDGYEAVCAPDCSDDQVKKVRSLSIAADIQMGVGLAALVTGVVWKIVDGRKEKLSAGEPTAWRMQPYLSPMATGVGVERRF